MLTDGSQTSIGANATVNVVSGHPIEFIGRPSIFDLWATADAEGLTMQWLTNVGGEQSVPVAAGTSVNVAAVTGAGPKQDEDQVGFQNPLPLGARSQFNITNTTGSAILFRWRALIRP